MRWIRGDFENKKLIVASSCPSRLPQSDRLREKSPLLAPKLREKWGTRILLVALFASGLVLFAAPDKHLSVYSVAANYSLPLTQRDNRDYVGLLELLEPLGRVSAKSEGSKWRLKYNNVEGEFQSGKNKAKVQGRDADLGAKFYIENNRGLVPVSALSSLLPRILGGPVNLHEESGRLFVGGVATHFTASLTSQNPPRLVFNFTAPVNPLITNEPGALRMTFSHEPVVAPASPTLTFGNKAIASANYSEGSGNAVVTVNATIPVMASFSNNGRTVTIAPTAAPGVEQTSPAAATPGTPAPAQQTAVPAVAAAQIPRRYFAVVDASHGGDDHGEALGGALVEKDVTVALARSLRQELESRGITTLVLRDSDANLSLDQRAIFTNADHAAIYIALHAGSSGHGVRVYTALLPYAEDDRGPFRAWDIAQRTALTLSRTAASAVTAELQKRQIPVRNFPAPLRPLNNLIGAAIAVEVAPQGSDVNQLTAPDYQQLVTSAVATAIAANRDQLGAAQ